MLLYFIFFRRSVNLPRVEFQKWLYIFMIMLSFGLLVVVVHYQTPIHRLPWRLHVVAVTSEPFLVLEESTCSCAGVSVLFSLVREIFNELLPVFFDVIGLTFYLQLLSLLLFVLPQIVCKIIDMPLLPPPLLLILLVRFRVEGNSMAIVVLRERKILIPDVGRIICIPRVDFVFVVFGLGVVTYLSWHFYFITLQGR